MRRTNREALRAVWAAYSRPVKPSLRQLQAELGYRSWNSVAYCVDWLVKADYLERTGRYRSRAIRVRIPLLPAHVVREARIVSQSQRPSITC